MRCISLAAELQKKNINIYFICIELKGNFIKLAKSKGIKVLIIKNNSLANLMDENEKIYDSFEFQTQDAEATIFLIKDPEAFNQIGPFIFKRPPNPFLKLKTPIFSEGLIPPQSK